MTPFDSAPRYGIRSRAAVPSPAIDITAGYRELADIQILRGGEGGIRRCASRALHSRKRNQASQGPHRFEHTGTSGDDISECLCGFVAA